jgi:hypothetical protein
MQPPEPTYPERSLADVTQVLEGLLARNLVVAHFSTTDDLAKARIPHRAGPAFLALARAYRCLRLRDADVSFHLHEGVAVDDEIGGWRLRADPPEIDVRIATLGIDADDTVVDATWSPHGDEVVVHSTFTHFIVRAAVGNGV